MPICRRRWHWSLRLLLRQNPGQSAAIIPDSQLLSAGIAVRALGNLLLVLLMLHIQRRLESGQANSSDEYKLAIGMLLSTGLWAILLSTLDITLAFSAELMAIVGIVLISITMTMLFGSNLHLVRNSAAAGGFLGMLPCIVTLAPVAGAVVPLGLCFHIASFWIVSARLNRAMRKIIILGMRMQRVSEQLARSNSALSQALDRAQWLADRDVLTRLRNRRAFENALENPSASAAGERRHQAILLIDIDRFKSINDTFGHDVGDDVLKAIGTVLENWESYDPSRISARWGGEEFIAATLVQDEAEASRLAEGLRREISRMSDSPGWSGPKQISASIGCAMLSDRSKFDDAMKRADQALYAAKNSGRNCWKLAA